MWPRTQFRERAIDFIARNRATLDVNQSVGIAPEETNDSILCVNSDAVSICVLLWRRDNRTYRDIAEFADPLERVAHLSPFHRKLVFIAHVLVSASSTSAEIATLW